ncbi:hypothetical protein, partial [Hungatella hathewayi]|uniref:hypothetical protein n=1 Tax=Hungatella hathewayi TaxID=154046 RepID=UPI001A9BA3A3
FQSQILRSVSLHRPKAFHEFAGNPLTFPPLHSILYYTVILRRNIDFTTLFLKNQYPITNSD